MPDALAALAPGEPVTLLSGPGAGMYAGPLWWLSVVTTARRVYPDTRALDLLDCADGTAQAWAALRLGLTGLVLWAGAPGRPAFARLARARGIVLLSTRPR
jgi:hypothetical protein